MKLLSVKVSLCVEENAPGLMDRSLVPELARRLMRTLAVMTLYTCILGYLFVPLFCKLWKTTLNKVDRNRHMAIEYILEPESISSPEHDGDSSQSNSKIIALFVSYSFLVRAIVLQTEKTSPDENAMMLRIHS